MYKLLYNKIVYTVYYAAVITLYEGVQKREFPPSILFACLNIPFLVEIIILYKHLGPGRGLKYAPLKEKDQSIVD